MGKLSYQFFAMPKELTPLVEEWKQRFRFRMVAVQLFPEMKVVEIDTFEDLSAPPLDIRNLHSVMLGFAEPELEAKTNFELLANNEGFLVIEIGNLSEKGLEESAISVITDDDRVLTIWKNIARQLKKITKAGLWAVNTEVGGKGFYKNFRYTEGASDLSRNGIRFCSHNLFVYMTVDEPDK